MDEKNNSSQPQKIHLLQKFMDNPWLLLVLGLIIPTLSYTVWGLIDYLFMSQGQLP